MEPSKHTVTDKDRPCFSVRGTAFQLVVVMATMLERSPQVYFQLNLIILDNSFRQFVNSLYLCALYRVAHLPLPKLRKVT